MRWIKPLLIVMASLVAVFFVVGIFLPGEYFVTRSVTIEASPEQIHSFVGDLERWPEWTPWTELDPSIRTTVGETSSGVGARQTWTGESGTGELSFTEWDPRKGVAFDLSFDEGKYVSTSTLRYEKVDGGTRVTWDMQGENSGVIGRYFGLMMDSMVGPSYERGLAKLKDIAERLPAPRAIEPTPAAEEQAPTDS